MRILVIEDEPKVAASIKKGLEQERFSVDTVHDGESGLSYGQSDDYDLIILDRMLPGGLDGMDICAAWRADGIKTPVLILTAKDQVPEKVSGLNAGADDYMVKPFSFDELVARVRALLRRPNETKTPVIQVEDVELDPSNARVKRKGREVSLTAREFSVLEYLMRHAGIVISKDKLLQHLWNDDAEILPNTIEVYISYIRSKLDGPGQDTFIKMVRGFGYRVG